MEQLIWIDLETTGLDPDEDLIMEVGWILTDTKLNEKCAASDCVQHVNNILALKQMNEFSEKAHTESGLVADFLKATKSLKEIEQEILSSLGDEGSTVYLAGNSVHFDRGFIRKYMKALDKRLSYRHFDVRVLELAEKFWGHPVKVTTVSKHRAMDDIRHSLSTARDHRLSATQL